LNKSNNGTSPRFRRVRELFVDLFLTAEHTENAERMLGDVEGNGARKAETDRVLIFFGDLCDLCG